MLQVLTCSTINMHISHMCNTSSALAFPASLLLTPRTIPRPPPPPLLEMHGQRAAHTHTLPFTHKRALLKTSTLSPSSPTRAHTNRECLRLTPALAPGLRGQRAKPRQLQEFSTPLLLSGSSNSISATNKHTDESNSKLVSHFIKALKVFFFFFSEYKISQRHNIFCTGGA